MVQFCLKLFKGFRFASRLYLYQLVQFILKCNWHLYSREHIPSTSPEKLLMSESHLSHRRILSRDDELYPVGPLTSSEVLSLRKREI